MTSAPPLLLFAALQAQGGSGMSAFLLQMTIIFGLAYFLFLRPQQKQRRMHEERVKQLKRGDEVMTVGGLIGEVVHINVPTRDGAPAPSLEDKITIKSGESRVVIERGRIHRVTTHGSAEEEKTK
jgi:preprotein translocase subunit YajC